MKHTEGEIFKERGSTEVKKKKKNCRDIKLEAGWNLYFTFVNEEMINHINVSVRWYRMKSSCSNLRGEREGREWTQGETTFTRSLEVKTGKRLGAIIMRWQSEAGSVQFHPTRVVFLEFCSILNLVSKKSIYSPFGFLQLLLPDHVIKGKLL